MVDVKKSHEKKRYWRSKLAASGMTYAIVADKLGVSVAIVGMTITGHRSNQAVVDYIEQLPEPANPKDHVC